MNIKGISEIGKGSLIASVSVEISPGVIVNEFKIQRDRNGTLYVSPPAIHWVEDHQHYYQSAVTLSEPIKSLVNNKIIEYYEAMKGREL
jgi:hypothetical protein